MTLERKISASVRLTSPFFATLALHARFVESTEVSTAATDGRDVFVNPEFVSSLPPEHLDGVLLHEVLHAALQARAGRHDPVDMDLLEPGAGTSTWTAPSTSSP